MSVHHTLDLDGEYRAYREFSDAARQHGAGALYTTSLPADSYETMLTEVQKMKPQKRKNWKGSLQNTGGVKTRVRYVEAGIRVPKYNFVSHFENKLSGQMQSKYGTEQEWRVVLTNGLPRVDADNADELFHFRNLRDVRRDSMSSWEQSLDVVSETLGNLTGNHEPRNHRINIPTRAGKPVRG